MRVMLTNYSQRRQPLPPQQPQPPQQLLLRADLEPDSFLPRPFETEQPQKTVRFRRCQQQQQQQQRSRAKATRAKANTEEIINAHVFLLKENLRKESLPLALIERKASSSRFLLARAGVSAQNFSGRRFFAHSPPFFTLPLLASSVCRHFLLLPRNK